MTSLATAAPPIVSAAVRTASFDVEPCTPAIGAEISGLSLADIARDPDLVREVRRLWLKHKVLFFRNQAIDAVMLQDFASCFGELEAHPTMRMHPDAPLILPISRNLDPGKPNIAEQTSRENMWHADTAYVSAPARGSMLACEMCPPCGGDTIWSNMVLAYERLPERIKERLEGLYAKHSLEQVFGAQLPIDKRKKLAAKAPMVEHPVVCTHPETGERLLFVNQFSTSHFVNFYNFKDVRYGQDFFESGALLNFLVQQPQIPEYQVRLRWRPGTVAMWDNLLCQHYAVYDYGAAPRKMLRATFKGTPIA